MTRKVDDPAQQPGIETFTLPASEMQFSRLACGPRNGEVVLLLHGFPQFADSWTEVMLELANAGYSAIAVNQRGYSTGAQPKRRGAYTVDELVADVLGIADALGSGPIDLSR
ncbi:alpha/beta fold hydrolase [Brucella anthropi]|uniref:alpha/beta fold hydrolase n=1 Tax=Brucella anthropi TaxID=529 RepID=UPI0021668F14|nr:alpha/beta hydrolase [Brucella anthropi]UVV70613.1 alpha/beta hydrolase [Brucella anthropi]